MTWDLDRRFADVLASLPKDALSTLVFSSSSFASCPERIETDRLVVTKFTHGYGSGYRNDAIKFHATRKTFQELGLLILAVVFHPGGHRTHVLLNHPGSVIKNLVISYSGITARPSGHKTRPEKFSFSPETVERHPWKGWGTEYWPLSSFPTFTLTNMSEFVVSEADWATRDTVKGFGNDDASIRLAALLLNISSSDQNEIILEGEGGNRGVGIHSAEAVFEVSKDELA